MVGTGRALVSRVTGWAEPAAQGTLAQIVAKQVEQAAPTDKQHKMLLQLGTPPQHDDSLLVFSNGQRSEIEAAFFQREVEGALNELA
jgi:hypothetical protein